VVLADGRVIRTGGRARKSSAGYDLTRLLRRLGGHARHHHRADGAALPDSRGHLGAVCTFPDVDAAVETVIQTIQLGVPVARIELLDALSICGGQPLQQDFAGRSADAVLRIPRQPGRRRGAGQTGAGDRRRAGRRQLRLGDPARRPQPAVAGAARRLLRLPAAEARLPLLPDRRLRADLAPGRVHPATNEDIALSTIPIPLFGHVGDGNFHLVVLIDPDDPLQVAEAERINHAVVERALAMEGTSRRQIHHHRRARLSDRLPGAGAPADDPA
jgi:D-lactate dehydrogenase (cytochrome)